MKYLIMMFGATAASVADRSPDWIAGMHELFMKLDTELRECGDRPHSPVRKGYGRSNSPSWMPSTNSCQRSW